MKSLSANKWRIISIINLIFAWAGLFFAVKIILSSNYKVFTNFSFLAFLLFVLWGLTQFFALIFNERVYMWLNNKYFLTFLGVNQTFTLITFAFANYFNGFDLIYTIFVCVVVPVWFMLFYFLLQKSKNIKIKYSAIFIIFPILTTWSATENKIIYTALIIGYALITVLYCLISKIKRKKPKKNVR